MTTARGFLAARGLLVRPRLRSFDLDFGNDIEQIAAIMAVKTSEAPQAPRPRRQALSHQESLDR
jgi:hypothetical protein